ncbi:MAG TPA: hypothetical protein VGE41_09815, partial [Verrucomicrobiae bacterium]
MKKLEIETWALRILEAVKNKHRVEDANIELKSIWLDPGKAARRIAAHANAARGEPILWLIGVDEDKGILGVLPEELSNWYSQVQSKFDSVTPDLQDIQIIFEDKSITALCFHTDRAPYLVMNPKFGKESGETVKWEIPWREGTSTRTATRNDLLLLLVPISKAPHFEIMSCQLNWDQDKTTGEHCYDLIFQLYATPRAESTAVFPFHKVKGGLFNNNALISNAI